MVSFALIGCGRIGARHAEHIAKLGKLVAVCDIDETKATAFGKKYECDSYAFIKALLHEKNKKLTWLLYVHQMVYMLNSPF